MYQVAMYTTIKTLLSQGKSDRWIATHLQINRRTVKKIREDLEAGLKGPVVQIRTKKLSSYESQITQCIKAGLSAPVDLGAIKVWKSTVSRYILVPNSCIQIASGP